jgi:hypothetical protein
MLHRKTQAVVLMFLAMVLVSACAGNKPMTDKQQGAMWGSIYLVKYHQVETVLNNPSATQAHRELALKKKGILIRAWPLIKDFNSPVVAGDTQGAIVGYSMSTEKLNLLMSLIDELVSLTGGANANH